MTLQDKIIEDIAITDKLKACQEKLDAQLAEWNAQLILFRAKADKAQAAWKAISSREHSTVPLKEDQVRNPEQKEIAMTDKRKAYQEKLDALLTEWNVQLTLFRKYTHMLIIERKKG
ncbi:MAG: hypothetical protein Q8K00_05895 [Syntrophales bacterium]|nr:hypothetical protein [Syntrophales bacterium]